MKTLFIGVDPGKSGAISIIDEVSDDAFSIGLDDTDHDVYQALADLTISAPFQEPKQRFKAIVEKVHSSPQMGVKSAFTFGESFGKLQMLLACLGIPYEFVSPAKWQREMKCLTKGDKRVSKREAQRLFPNVKITHRNADSLLLAEYGRRKERA